MVAEDSLRLVSFRRTSLIRVTKSNGRTKRASRTTAEIGGCARRGRRVLFIQATEPANYPPLIHASCLMAEAGWDVTFLSAPIEGNRLELPQHPGIAVRA